VALYKLIPLGAINENAPAVLLVYSIGFPFASNGFPFKLKVVVKSSLPSSITPANASVVAVSDAFLIVIPFKMTSPLEEVKVPLMVILPSEEREVPPALEVVISFPLSSFVFSIITDYKESALISHPPI
jgi:hypothetical protein